MTITWPEPDDSQPLLVTDDEIPDYLIRISDPFAEIAIRHGSPSDLDHP